MLAFEPQTSKDVLICQIYKDEKSSTVVQDVYFSPIYKRDAESAIVTEDIVSVLRDDAFRLQREHGLSKVEYEHIIEGVKKNKPIDPTWPTSMKRAWIDIRDTISSKLKRELTLDRSDESFIRYYYNTTKPRTNNIIGVFGNSGTGKSWSVCRTIMTDPALHAYPKIRLIGTVGGSDPSFEPLREKMFQVYEYFNSDEMSPEDLSIKDLTKGKCIILDDIDSTANARVRKSLQLYRDRLLQIGRHKSLRIWNTAHLFNGYRETAKIRNSAKTLFIFPRGIPGTLFQILTKSYNWKASRAQHMVDNCIRDGRLTVISRNHPQFLCTPKRIVLL